MSAEIPPRPDIGGTPHLPVAPEAGSEATRPRATWRWYEVLGVGFVAMLVGAFPALAIYVAFGRSPGSRALGGVDFLANGVVELVVLVALVVYLHLRHPGWRRTIGFPKASDLPRELGLGVGLGLALTFGLSWLVQGVLQPLIRALVHHRVEPANQIGSGITGLGAVSFVVSVVVIAPVVEEFFFRGLFFRSIRDRLGFIPGAVISGLLFGLLHSGAGTSADVVLLQIAIGLLGIGLAGIYEWRGTLAANVAAHMTFNLVTVLSVLHVFR